MADYKMDANAYTASAIYGGNTLSFAIGVAQTPDGWVARIYHGGVEIWQTPSSFADPEIANRHAVKHLAHRLAATLK